MISLITTGPTFGAALRAPVPARNASTLAGELTPKVGVVSAVKSPVPSGYRPKERPFCDASYWY